jgi:hypothetical protein
MGVRKKDLGKALGMWMDDTVGAMQDELIRIDANDQGQLVAATTRDPVRDEGRKLTCKGHNDAEHASVVEWGRLAKSGLPPPLLPLVAWAGRKGIVDLPRNINFGGEWVKKWAASGAIFRAMKKGKSRSTGPKKPLDPQIRDLLIIRSIANKIFEKGIVGRHPFSRIWDRRSNTATRDIAALLRILK